MAATINILTIRSSKASQTYEQKGGTGSTNTLFEPKSFSLFSKDDIPFAGSVFNFSMIPSGPPYSFIVTKS